MKIRTMAAVLGRRLGRRVAFDAPFAAWLAASAQQALFCRPEYPAGHSGLPPDADGDLGGESGGRGGAVAAGRAVRAGPYRLGFCDLFQPVSADRSGGGRLLSAGRTAGSERKGSVFQAPVRKFEKFLGKGEALWDAMCWR